MNSHFTAVTAVHTHVSIQLQLTDNNTSHARLVRFTEPPPAIRNTTNKPYPRVTMQSKFGDVFNKVRDGATAAGQQAGAMWKVSGRHWTD
jgi:hypothetical protein